MLILIVIYFSSHAIAITIGSLLHIRLGNRDISRMIFHNSHVVILHWNQDGSNEGPIISLLSNKKNYFRIILKVPISSGALALFLFLHICTIFFKLKPELPFPNLNVNFSTVLRQIYNIKKKQQYL